MRVVQPGGCTPQLLRTTTPPDHNVLTTSTCCNTQPQPNLHARTTGEATTRPGMQRNRRFFFTISAFVMASAGIVARGGGHVTSTVGIRKAVVGVALARAPSSRSKRYGLSARPGRQQSSSGVWIRGISGSNGDRRKSGSTPVPSSSIWSYPKQHSDGSTSTYPSATAGRLAQVAEAGVVYFVSTPIGNLEDITLR